MDSVNETVPETNNQKIKEKLSHLTQDNERESEYIRNSLQTYINVINAHLIEGLEHREIDALTLSYPLDSNGNVTTNGSISSRMLYRLGIKGQENGKSKFIGIFENTSIEKLIQMLIDARTTYEEKQRINMIINLFQINKVANNCAEFKELLNAYDQLYMAKVNRFSKITVKTRTKDPLLRVLLESRTLLEEEIELEMIPKVLREMALQALQIIKSEQIEGFENEVQELNRILEDDVSSNNSGVEANMNSEESAYCEENTTTDTDTDTDTDYYTISIEDKTLIEVEPPFTQEQEVDFQRVNQRRSSRRSTKRNYEREQRRNKVVGDAAEKLVLSIEKEKLLAANRSDLVEYVEHVSETQGDGLGYDIKSFEIDGTEIYIEVKGSIETANKGFHISDSEVRFSRESADSFYLYRLYDLNSNQPKYFKLKGSIEENFKLKPAEYFAILK